MFEKLKAWHKKDFNWIYWKSQVTRIIFTDRLHLMILMRIMKVFGLYILIFIFTWWSLTVRIIINLFSMNVCCFHLQLFCAAHQTCRCLSYAIYFGVCSFFSNFCLRTRNFFLSISYTLLFIYLRFFTYLILFKVEWIYFVLKS